MSSVLVHLILATFSVLGLSASAGAASPPAPIVLSATTPTFTLESDLAVWVESSNGASVQQVADMPGVFHAAPALQRTFLEPNSTLWIRLPLQRTADAPTQWNLHIPMPALDEATLFLRNAQGQWQEQRAGDTLSQSQWTRRGLYPDFTVELPDTQVRVVFLRLHNFKHVSTPIRLAPSSEREFQRNAEFIGLGLILGILCVLCFMSLVRFAEHRNLSDAVAAAFTLLILLTTAQINGVLNMVLWGPWTLAADYASSFLPVIAIGTSLLFVRMLYAISTHYAHYDRFLRGIGVLTLVSALTYAIDRQSADRIGAIVLVVAATTGLIATFLSWRGNSRIWQWLILAYVPQYVCLIRLTLEAAGMVPTMWEMRYLLSLSVAMSVPVLVYALARVTHDRKELFVRARHLPTQDALTGLLTRDAFQSELERAYDRVIDDREPMAVVVVRVVNYEHIRKGLGDPLAENSLLRAVVKLHRILRDVDPAGRVAADEFGLILEGVSTRQALTERMVQLIGSGLIPLPGLEPPITLQFHAACLLLHENPIPAAQALQSLEEMLAGMSSHTRRPIRFLEAPQTMPAPMVSSSSLP